MRYIITGAGQIGTQLALDLVADGHDVTVVRRGDHSPEGTVLLRGDAGDRDLLRRAVGDNTAAIFHCIHSSYDAGAWRRDLPHREQAVMDIAAEAGIPVIFPESVYAFGTQARDLREPFIPAPASPLGEVRAELLAARKAHPARTVSVVAADLIGPTAEPGTAVYLLLNMGPASRGKTVWALGDPDAPRSITDIRDLTRTMVGAAGRAVSPGADGDTVLTAESLPPRSQRRIAAETAREAGARAPRVVRVPWWVLRVAGLFDPTMRELRNQRYLWDAPAVIG
ncbi:MAG: NAD-dependent epimerase/dehydratase family protein [Mycobacteriaceae bacterium]|uniref:NAD-dependent epimerase/dehydratase family protein n=1 Tax=Corynebacterium sp. TaxID=1720 RepID=UPI003F9C338C